MGGEVGPEARAEHDDTSERGRSGRRLALLIGAPLLVIVGAYLALLLWQGDKTASGTTVAGVDVGGMSEDEAHTALSKHASALGKKPVTIRLGSDERAQVVPAKAGLRLDVDASLAEVGGKTANPFTLISRVFGGQEHDGVIDTDRTKLADAVHRAAGSKLTTAPKDGSVSIEGGELKVVRSTSGEGIDADAVAQDIASGWPDKTGARAKIAEREPRLANTEIDRFVKEFATPAVSGPLTVASGDESVELSPDDIAELVTIKQSGGKLAATVDGKKAADALIEDTPDLETLARNAKVKISGGKVAGVAAGRNGRVLDEKKLGPALVKALGSTERRMTAPTKVQKPEVTKADLKGVGSGSTITEFRSKFPGGASNKVRTHNMRVALRAINGTVVPKGDQFSLIETLGGDLTPEKGYGAAPTIQGGKERAAQGGGVSQVSTAMYNAAFFAGVQLDEHKSHSFWIERYPAGREATIWVPKIDNKWTNDTDQAVVIVSHIEGDEVVVKFLGKRKYEVETKSSKKYNIRQPKTVYDDHKGCLPVPTNIGFDIDVTRTLKQGGKVVRTEKDTTSYNAANRVVCTAT